MRLSVAVSILCGTIILQIVPFLDLIRLVSLGVNCRYVCINFFNKYVSAIYYYDSYRV